SGEGIPDAVGDGPVPALHVDRAGEGTEKPPVLGEGAPAGLPGRQLLPEVGHGVQFKPAGYPGRPPPATGEGPYFPAGIVKGSLDTGRTAAHDGHLTRRGLGCGGGGRVHRLRLLCFPGSVPRSMPSLVYAIRGRESTQRPRAPG